MYRQSRRNRVEQAVGIFAAFVVAMLVGLILASL